MPQQLVRFQKAILDGANYSIISTGAENGLDGVKLAMADRPDLIICDVMMPELDGYGVLRNLRQNPNTAAILFIFLTAKADKSALRQGMELGADDYLTKPFTKTQLLGAIATRLEKHAVVAQHFEEELVSFVQSITDALPTVCIELKCA